MNTPILISLPGWTITIIVFLLILLLNWLGFRYKLWEIKKNPEAEGDGLGPAEGSMLGFMALLLAFTFNMAATKFENRRDIIIEEANAIGTAILRCDMYPDSAKKIFRQNFAQYLEARIAYYDAGTDEKNIKTALHESDVYSGNIWKLASALSQDRENIVRSGQMIPALNAMIDIVTTRENSRIAKVPPLILWMLLLLTLVSSFLSGYAQKTKQRNRVMIIAFALMTALTLYLIMELDRPRKGWITLDPAQEKIVNLRQLLVEQK